jgi:hypothetical protein
MSMSYRQRNNRTVKVAKYLTETNKNRALKLRGLPFSVTLDDIQ